MGEREKCGEGEKKRERWDSEGQMKRWRKRWWGKMDRERERERKGR